MPSFKARILSWIIWWWFKSTWSSAEGINNRIAKERLRPERVPPKHLYKEFAVEEYKRKGHIADYVVYIVSPKTETPTRGRILYLHGGGFVFDITPQHWELVAQLARRLNATVTVPIYPLGPETSLMKMYEFVQPLHDELASAPDRTPFWVIGDSAGGTMSLVLTQNAKLAGKQTAQRIVPITPCTDSSLVNPELHNAALKDPWLDVPGIAEITRLICPEMDTQHPNVSPIYGDLRLPPMLVFAAGLDLLTPDTKKMVEMAKEQGTKVELVYGEGMIHVWPILPIQEGRQAVDKMVEWLGIS
ncbi:alpha/beta hydrolase fold-domain-containing protein [Fusarium redolens]|jgi:acetyl esterase/lipase|uniref:Alpha/beta hydrolase fold-domain-containing protein n=1 Tax=Fusarium redolens TaxID=48865 RepID=A0A9P9H0T0_FUSRE|nr:alpha/beta hydrolase fold-domain-containing protein [Fusarium redolens]KAH7248941.1 alpha/beta hydrolase fold-domain-containing protein [Fusarium redolens]